mmetsp:Transcript_28130/g.23607  ORF Transcript_28130/g.23607 Transcript_28130/m.23607 type:complete len:85 (-) Transcript_28130:478-732(-)
MLEVRDDGKGITPDKIKKVFDVMETDQNAANYDGTGLGLSICEYLCKQTNSVIYFKSEPNLCTIFRYFYPIEKAGGCLGILGHK